MNPVINRQDSATLKNEGKPVRVNPYLIRVNPSKVKLNKPPAPIEGQRGLRQLQLAACTDFFNFCSQKASKEIL